MWSQWNHNFRDIPPQADSSSQQERVTALRICRPHCRWSHHRNHARQPPHLVFYDARTAGGRKAPPALQIERPYQILGRGSTRPINILRSAPSISYHELTVRLLGISLKTSSRLLICTWNTVTIAERSSTSLNPIQIPHGKPIVGVRVFYTCIQRPNARSIS